jgi:hypothetical protein
MSCLVGSPLISRHVSGEKAGCFEAMAHDLRVILRLAAGKNVQPTATVVDGGPLPSSCESGPRAGYIGHMLPCRLQGRCSG